MEEMNARWQGFMEQHERYARALEQRCSELEHAANLRRHWRQQSTDDQQRQLDHILLEQQQKTEMVNEARFKVTKISHCVIIHISAKWNLVISFRSLGIISSGGS